MSSLLFFFNKNKFGSLNKLMTFLKFLCKGIFKFLLGSYFKILFQNFILKIILKILF